MSCLGHQPFLGARYWPREAWSLCGCFVRRWVRTCSWSIPGLNLSDFLLIGPYLDRLVLYRERDASIDCLWPECRIANLSKNDARALNELKCDKSIGNLPVDKGHSTVVMNKSNYKNKAKHLLDDTSAYTVVVGNPLSGVVNRLNAFLLRLKAENKITHREQQLMRVKD